MLVRATSTEATTATAARGEDRLVIPGSGASGTMLSTGASRTDDVVWAAAVAGKNGAVSATAPGRLMIRGTTGVERAAGMGAAGERPGLAAASFAGGGSWTDGLDAADCSGRLLLRGMMGAGMGAAGERPGLAAASFAGGGSWTDGLDAADCSGRLLLRGMMGAGMGAAGERSGLAAASFAGGVSWTDGLGAADCSGSLALRATLAANGVAAGSWEEYAATWLAFFGVTKIASIPSKGANPAGISTAGGVRARRSAQ